MLGWELKDGQVPTFWLLLETKIHSKNTLLHELRIKSTSNCIKSHLEVSGTSYVLIQCTDQPALLRIIRLEEPICC